MKTDYLLLVIGLMCLITFFFRVFPFYFMEILQKHKVILYLGETLPACIMSILALYSLKDINLTVKPFGIPELATVLVVAVLHFKKRNILLSMLVGTILYAALDNFLTT